MTKPFSYAASIIFILLFITGCSIYGSGKVLNYDTKEPIGDAVVTMDCRERRPLHGSDSTSITKSTTDENGNFNFKNIPPPLPPPPK